MIRYGGIAMGCYLALFGTYQARAICARQRAEYLQLVDQAQKLKAKVETSQMEVQSIKDLMEKFKFDPATLSRATLVGQASAAIQRAALSDHLQLGPIREPPAQSSAKELALQFEANGQIVAAMGFLSHLESLGFPIMVDSVQITTQTAPGMVKLNLTIDIVEFDLPKGESAPHA